jgi:hypothetical protein
VTWWPSLSPPAGGTLSLCRHPKGGASGSGPRRRSPSTTSPYWPDPTLSRSGKTANARRSRTVRFDGGLPPWSFRSDRKNGYTIVGGEKNGLAERTIRTLAYCHVSSSTTTFENCEFTNAHDILLNGPDTVFRHNWVHNINDDGVFVGRIATNLRITGNVFEKCLMVVSLASKSTSGPIFLHRT